MNRDPVEVGIYEITKESTPDLPIGTVICVDTYDDTRRTHTFKKLHPLGKAEWEVTPMFLRERTKKL